MSDPDFMQKQQDHLLDTRNSLEGDAVNFFNLSTDIMCISTFDGFFKNVNPAFTRILGWSRDEALRKPWIELIRPDEIENAIGFFDDLKRGIPKNLQRIWSIHKNGEYRCISWDSYSLVEEALVFSVGRDVTEQRVREEALERSGTELELRAEERKASLQQLNDRLTREISRCGSIESELLEREARLKEAQSVAHVGSWDYNITTDSLRWSDEMCRVFGVTQEEFGGSYEAFLDAIDEEDRERVDKAYTDSIRNRTPYDITYKLTGNNGQIKYVHARCETFYDASGQPVRSIGTVQDVTERKRYEASLAQSEQRFRLIAETINDVFWISGLGLDRLIYVSPAYEKVWGRQSSMLYEAPESFLDAVHPDDYELAKRMMTNFHAKGKRYSYEYRIAHPDGSVHWIFERGFPVVDADGMITSICGVSTEITERKNFEERLRKSEELYRLMVEKSSDVIWMLDPYSQRFVFVSASCERVFGYTSEEALETKLTDWLTPEWRPVVVASLQQMLEEKLPNFTLECEIYRRDGATIWCEIQVSIWKDEIAGSVMIAGSSRDISDRKLVESSLLESEKRFSQVAALTGEWVWEVDKDGLFLYCSSAVFGILGYFPEEMVGQMYWCVLGEDPEEQMSLTDVRNAFGSRREFKGLVTTQICKDGRRVIIESRGFPFTNTKGEFAGYRGINRDITEVVRATESRELLAAVVEHGADSVVVTDTKGEIKYVNPAFTKVSGYTSEEAVGTNPRVLKSGLHDDSFYKGLWESVTAGKVWTGHFINRKKDGSLFEEDATISPMIDPNGKITNYVAVKRDVTKEVALQNKLAQSQKMEAIGTLAGGIAHDFNNIIFAITGYAELALDSVQPESGTARNIEYILEASGRAAEMVKQILTFSRKSATELIPVDLGPLIKEGVKFLRATIPSTIEIQQRIDPGPARVIANPTQIHQVLMNLCANASYSMRETKGVLSIELKQVYLDSDFCGRNSLESPGNYIRLTVSDTGHGIPDDIMQRIFEPYFTTKEVDEGTGMGLAVAHGIVKCHHGAMTVKSEPGVGSTFQVFFPVIQAEALPEKVASESEVSEGTERVLLVEDEEIILDMEKAILEFLGYSVVETTDPQKALKIFESDPMAFDLIISDLTMPRMTGIELIENILRIRNNFPAILCTGYGHKLTEKQIRESGVKAVINKPLRKKEMARTIRNVLDL